MKQSINQSINQSVSQSVSQSVNQSGSQSERLEPVPRLSSISINLNFSLTEVLVFFLFLQFLRGILTKQPCESLLASPKRQLLYEGPLTLLGKS